MGDHFSQQAKLYAKYRPSYPEKLYDFILSHLNRKHRAWDCGTGSGQVASYLADHFEVVYASDISKKQMAHAPQKPNIEYYNVPAEKTGFARDSFDLITVAQAIHWFDFSGFYREVQRTAKPNALLAVIGYGFVRVDEQINPTIDTFYKDMFSTYFSQNRAWLDQQYQTIPFPFDEIPSPFFEITLRWNTDDLEGYFNTWSTVQKFKTEKKVNPADSVMKSIRARWPEHELHEISFPVFLRLGRVNK